MPLKACVSKARFWLGCFNEDIRTSKASSIYSDDNLLNIRESIARGGDPNYKREGKCTPFLTAIAILEDNIAVVRELIDAGADVNLADCFLGLTPLHLAVQSGKLLVTIAILKSGAFINAKDLQGKTPLHYAVTPYPKSSNPRIIKKLLDHEDIDCDSVDSNGDTALMLAVKNRQFQSVVLLLHNKANPNIRNNDQETPLHAAFARNSSLIKNELILHGACIYAEDKLGHIPMDILVTNLENGIWSLSIDVLVKVKIIAFKYSTSEDLKIKFQCVPKLAQFFEEWCDEVDRMRTDYISSDVTVYDFLSDQLIGDGFNNFNLQIHKTVVERLSRDIYPEYFYDILKVIPRSSLFAILETFAPSNYFILIICLVSDWLSDLDIFGLIVAFSNVEIADSLQNLDVREICAIHNFR